MPLSPTNSTTVSEWDYWQRDSSQQFLIEAVLSLSEASGINTQKNFSWPWTWNGADAVVPIAKKEAEDLPDADDSVYRVRVRVTHPLIPNEHEPVGSTSIAVADSAQLIAGPAETVDPL